MIVDDFYTLTEQDLIWEELESYHHLFKKDDKTGKFGTAIKDGKPLAKLNRIYLEELYSNNREDSNILTAYKKIVSKEVIENYERTTSSGKQFRITDCDCSIVSYYDNLDKYGEHFDSFMHTVLVWFYREPKRFKGGNLIFTEPNEKIECKHNRIIIFPSYYLHEIDEVTLEEKYRNKRLGRYCITHFYYKT
tara:strand:- start:755 stop:1330 length:576 start_codon:yes stop_codon:yes gene_type:complete